MEKIGIIDSGIGGLTLLKGLIDKNIEAELYYISDEMNVPYGDKDQDFMYERVLKMFHLCGKKGVRNFVIACNTLTAETIDKLRTFSPNLKIFGIEPYINYLNKETVIKDAKVGLILTPATYRSARFQNLRDLKDPEGKIHCYTPKKLALIIEELKYKSLNDQLSKIEDEISFLKNENLDYLLLGCTHYPIISKQIENFLGVKTVDPHQHVINYVFDALCCFGKKKHPGDFYYNAKCSNEWKTVNLKDFYFLSQNFIS